MDLRISLIGLILLVALAAAVEQPDLEVHPPGPIKAGDTVGVVCRIGGAGILTVNKLQRVDDSGVAHDIAVNNLLQPPYNRIPRYSTSGDRSAIHAEVTITDMEGSDSGRYVCRGDGVEAVEDLHVHVAPYAVTLRLWEEGEVSQLSPGETLRLREGEEAYYECVVAVDGSDRRPHVAVLLAGQDVTESMGLEEVPVVIALEGGRSERHLTLTYTVESNSPLLAARENTGQELTCTAHAVHFPPISTSVTLDVAYGPERTLECLTEQLYMPGDSLLVSCVVAVYPAQPNAIWLLDGNIASDEARFTQDVEELGNHEYDFQLTIDAVATDEFEEVTLRVSAGGHTEDMYISLERSEVDETEPEPDNNGEDGHDHNSNHNSGSQGIVNDNNGGAGAASLANLPTLLLLLASLLSLTLA